MIWSVTQRIHRRILMVDKSKTVLLIGSDGFLGKWFKDFLTKNGNEFRCYDIENGDDICKSLDDLPRYDYVINCAGIASPEKYMKKPVETLDVSYVGTKNVLDYCVKHKIESVIMYSSSEVYGTPTRDNIPTKETYIGTIPTRNSRSCYDIGKQVLETLCYIYFNTYGVNVKVIRPFNFYGPHMGINDNRVLSNWMRNYLNDEDIVVYGDGQQTRTFCYAGDGIDMCLGVLVNGKNGEVYNVGNPTPELTMVELAKVFCDVLNYEGRYVIKDYPNYYPKDEPLRRCANIDKVVRDTSIQPKVTLQDGLLEMLDYFNENFK